LTGEWVLVSPHRATRPWLGHRDQRAQTTAPSYDPQCYLCPGNARAGGIFNPPYTAPFVFDNDFAALLLDSALEVFEPLPGVVTAQTERGICRVVCFSPNHALSVPLLSQDTLESVIRTWADQTEELTTGLGLGSVQIFENRGEMMGASNPHPHCQIWANAGIPDALARETFHQQAYWAQHSRTLLSDYLDYEVASGLRVVIDNRHWTALVPYWAVWPFETLLVPKRAFSTFLDMSEDERKELALVMRTLTTRYDNLFETPFPYTMGFHQAPFDGREHPEFHFHAHYYPPLLRSAEVRKFMVGYEMLAGPQRDITAESAAERLRALPERHYLATD
jgi:UDPglucose--hexose-1-phosphate uridylyltransferase